MSESNSELPLHMQITYRLNRFSRFIRILIAGFIALIVTAAIFPIVDSVYLNYFYDPDAPPTLAAIISSTIGGLMYAIGWRLIVGTIGEELPARKAVLWYFVIGLLAFIIVALLILQGISMTDEFGARRI